MRRIVKFKFRAKTRRNVAEDIQFEVWRETFKNAPNLTLQIGTKLVSASRKFEFGINTGIFWKKRAKFELLKITDNFP